jgi:ribosomal protein S18 acetylase RimI-like enzyme
MATAPLTTAEIRIVPLVEAEVSQLERLFDEQCEEWLELLGWDYSGASELIRQVVRDGDLTGFVALAGSQAIGFIYYVIENTRCSIGEIFITRAWRSQGVDQTLAAAVIERVGKIVRVRRLESQSLNIENQAAHEFFENYGFTRFDRNYMIVQLANRQSTVPGPLFAQPADILIRAWQPDDFSESVKVIQSSYKATIDSRINQQYCTEDGCADLLTVITENIWCGNFLPHVSRVAVDRKSGKVRGLLAASRISKGRGHISQISVRQSEQGRGIGRQMMRAALNEFSHLNFDTVSLAVTDANTHALRLYESCGFRTVHRFPVFYLDR